MKNLFGKFNFKVGTTIAVFFAFAVVLSFAPRVLTVSKAEGCAVYENPVFNPFPVTWETNPGAGCNDFAVIAGGVHGSNQWSDNVQANVGDTVTLRVYMHNGAKIGAGQTMHGVQYNVNLDTSAGSNHNVSATLSASNAASISGSINISTPAGAHLEVVTGDLNYSLGDLEACFDFSRAFFITLKVVAPAAQPSGQIDANYTNPISGQCLYTGYAHWTTQNVSSALVTVTDTTASPNSPANMSGVLNSNGNEPTPWLTPGHHYKFILYNTSNGGQSPLGQPAEYTVPDLNCNTTPPPSPTGTISVSVGEIYSTNPCLKTGGVTWSTSNVTAAQVYVLEPGGSEVLFAGANSANNSPTPWIRSGHEYIFILYNTSNGAHTELKRTTTGVVPAFTCEAPVSEDFSVDINPTTFCPTTNPVFTVRNATSGLKGKQIYWSSTYNGQSTGEVNQGYNGQTVDNNGFWSAQVPGSAYASYIGSWTKTATIGGISHSVNFTVVACTTPPVVCPGNGSISVSPATINVGQSATVSAPSGWLGGSFVSSNTGVASLNGASLRGNAAGTSSISGSGFTAPNGATNCQLNPATITVVQPSVQNVSCVVSPGAITVGQQSTFAAAGGDGAYSWTINGQFASDKQSFTNTYNNAGNFVGVVTSRGTTATCTLQVVPPTNVCTPNSNFAINTSSPVKNGSTYSTTVSWSSTGSNQIKITQINPGAGEVPIISNGANSGSTQVANLQPGSTYIFRMYDLSSCGGFLTSTQVTIPTNPQSLTCVADSSVYNINNTAIFRVSGGQAPYSWTGGGNPFSANGSVFSTVYSNSGTKTVTVSSSDGQSAQCSTVINQPTQSNGLIQVDKEVRNITNNETAFSHSTSGKQNDTVEYQIKVWAATSVTLNNVVVTDTFTSGLTYISGSLTVNGQAHAPGLSTGGLTFATLGQAPIVITYRATINAVSGTFVNTATAKADNATNIANDQALVTVIFVQPGSAALSITKQVQNVTKSTGFSSSVNAEKNDVIKYQVVVKNIGSATAKNVFVNDSNPIGVQPITNVTASVNFTGGIPAGIALGDLAPGASVTITYQGTVKLTSSDTIINTATVSSDNATSQNAQAIVVVSVIQTQTNTGGDCNNSVNSCNTNTNTNTSTNTNSTNSSNQNNNNNINGNSNTVTNTNNNCVNNSCNTYYITTQGNTVPANQFAQLSITKNVRNVNGGTYQNSVTVNNNDTVQFEIVVTNTGSATANNVRLTDNLPNGLSLINGTVQVNGNYASDSTLYNNAFLGNLTNGQQMRINFQARVNIGNGTSIQNSATASSDNAGSVQASAWVFVNNNTGCTYNCVQGGNVSLAYSKRAFNETKNIDAQSGTASKEDFITYTLTVTNNGNTPANNFVITDDLSQVLPYADMTDNGGGNLSGNVINYPGITVPAGGSVSRSFKVRVKFSLADNLSYVMTNTYGNTVTIRINPQVLGAFTAPKTGADTMGVVFSTFLTAAAAIIRKRKALVNLIFS